MMNKNICRVFLLTTLLVMLVGLGVLSAANVNDNTTTQSITPVTNTQSASISDTVDNKVAEDIKVVTASKSENVGKEVQTTKNINKTVKKVNENKNINIISKSKSDNSNKIVLTEDNYNQYFDDFGTYTSTKSDIELGSDFYNKTFIFDSNIDQINNPNHYTLYNSSLTFSDTGNYITNVNNITIVNTDNRTTSITCEGQYRYLDFKNLTIYQMNNNEISSVKLNGNYPVYFEYSNFSVISYNAVVFDINNADLYMLNNNITVSTNTTPIVVNNSRVYIAGNSIVVKEDVNKSIILLNNSKGTNNILGNYLISSFASGDNTIESINSNVTARLNFPSTDNNVTFINLNITDKIDVNRTNTIQVKVRDSVGRNVNEGSLLFKINGNETYTAKVENGTASITYYPQELGYYPVELSYNTTSGNYMLGRFTLENKNSELILNFTVHNASEKVLSRSVKEVTAVTVNPVNINSNIINFTAHVTYGNNTPANGGKLVFKVNDKTLRDNKGNALYTDVIKGNAELKNFNIPINWNNRNITLSAVYSGTDTLTGARSNNVTMNIAITGQSNNLKSRNIISADNTGKNIVIDETNYRRYINETQNLRDLSDYTEVTLKNIPVTVHDYSIPVNQTLTLVNTSISGVGFHNNTTLRGGILKSGINIRSDVSNVTIDNITANYEHGSGWAIYVQCDYFTIRNSRINMTMVSNTIDWRYSSEPSEIPLYVGGRSLDPVGNYATLENNNITVYIEDYSGNWPTAYGIYVTGNGATIKNNNIKMTNKEGVPGWLYAIDTTRSNNTIIGNNMTVQSVNYTAGIYMDGWYGAENNYVANNIIHLEAGNASYHEDNNFAENVGYGITLTNGEYTGSTFTGGNYKNCKVINNTIYARGYAIYGIEGFGITDTIITNNTIELNGTAVSGISVIGVRSNITGNDITVNGKDNKTYQTGDYLTEQTTGINIQLGGQNNITHNTITCDNNAGIIVKADSNNNITYNIVSSANNPYTIYVDDYSKNIRVINNTLQANKTDGDASVRGSTNTTISNEVKRLIDVLRIQIPDFIKVVGDNVTINGSLLDESGNPVKRASITLTIDDEAPVIIKVGNDGTFKYTCTATQQKDNITVKAEYNGGAFYIPVEDTTFFDVEKLGTYIDLNQISTTTPNNTITIRGQLKEQFTNKELVNQAITITSNNRTYQTTTNENGTFTLNITAPDTSGISSIKASYNSNNKYDTASTASEYNVEKLDTNIIINTVNKTNYNNNINITGTLTDTTNTQINNATIIITLNNKNYTVITENGEFNLTVKADTIGINNITVTYNGNSIYNPASSKTAFNVSKANSIITTGNMTGYLGSNVLLNATIKDTNGNIIPDGTVIIKLNGKTNGYTNITNGKISYKLYLDPNKYGKEGYNVTFTYTGSNTTQSTRTDTRLNVIPFSPVINLTVNDTDLSDTVVMIVKVTNGRNYSALSGNIRFKINGLTYKINKEPLKVQVTNGTVTLKFYASKKFIGYNNITILYSGNGKFDQIKQEFTNALLVRNQKKTLIHIDQVNTKIGENKTINIKLTGTDGKPLTKGSIAIKINGKTFGHANITNGTATYTLKIDPAKLSAKNYTLTIKFGGKGKYQPATVNTTLQITKYTPKITYTKTQNGTNTRITVNIRDGQIKANNGTVGLKINGKTYKINSKSVTVKPSNGIATFTVPTSMLPESSKLTFTYSGDKQFNGIKQTI